MGDVADIFLKAQLRLFSKFRREEEWPLIFVLDLIELKTLEVQKNLWQLLSLPQRNFDNFEDPRLVDDLNTTSLLCSPTKLIELFCAPLRSQVIRRNDGDHDGH